MENKNKKQAECLLSRKRYFLTVFLFLLNRHIFVLIFSVRASAVIATGCCGFKLPAPSYKKLKDKERLLFICVLFARG